jgi:uncharacterized protein
MPDIDLVDTFLSSDQAHMESMGISDLDGFLTGIACSPELVPEDEWLDKALGNAAEAPDAVVFAVREMLQDIVNRIEQNAPLDPLFWEKTDGTVIAMDWCEGFMDAVKMRPERWDAFAQTDTGAKLMLPILVHMIDDEGNSAMDIPQEELSSTLDTAAEAIPMVVPAIYHHIRMITRN